MGQILLEVSEAELVCLLDDGSKFSLQPVKARCTPMRGSAGANPCAYQSA